MATDDPDGVVTLSGDGGVDQLLRRAIVQIEALGFEIFAVIDHSGDAAEAGLSMPDAKLLIFGSPSRETELMLAHPRLALDLPLKLLICASGDGEVSVSYTAPGYLARRYGLTDGEADALRVVETIAHGTRSNPMTTATDTPTVFPNEPNVGGDATGGGQAIVDGLSRLLADTYTLQLKSQNYHWNVTGPMFHTLHLLFGTHSSELAVAVDLIAERIRALDAPAPATYREFARCSTIDEEDDRPDATAMIRRLLAGQDAVIRTARSVFPAVEQAHDEPTADLLTQRVQAHEKSAWMLRSLLA